MKSPMTCLLKNLSDSELSDIAKRITYLRQDVLHMTQTEFSMTINISQTYLSQIELCQKKITASTIQKICTCFKIKREWLILGEGSDIFLSPEDAHQTIIEAEQEAALLSLLNNYHLDASNEEFLRWYLSLTPEIRLGFQNATKFLRQLDR